MDGVQYGEKHSWHDWHMLTATRITVSPPEAKTKMVDVPGSDLTLDLTEALGPVRYKRRKIEAEFLMTDAVESWEKRHGDIIAYMHGKVLPVVLDSDRDYYYTGRIAVTELRRDGEGARFTVTVDAEPYKRERYGSGERL